MHTNFFPPATIIGLVCVGDAFQVALPTFSGFYTSISGYSLNQRSSIENNHSVEEQARQEEVHTGTKQPRQLQRESEQSKTLKGDEILEDMCT